MGWEEIKTWLIIEDEALLDWVIIIAAVILLIEVIIGLIKA